MQYSFLLPADYDMGIVDRCIADRGHLTDHFAGLQFKAYLVAKRNGGRLPSRDNLYAPFYVWNDTEGLNNFVCGEGFDGVSKAFGRAPIRTWVIWTSLRAPNIADAKFASRSVHPIEGADDLRGLRSRAGEEAERDLSAGALASVSAFEPTTWSCVRFQLWQSPPPEGDGQHYEVGHLSLP